MARFPQAMAIESSEYVLNRGAFQSCEASEKGPGPWRFTFQVMGKKYMFFVGRWPPLM